MSTFASSTSTSDDNNVTEIIEVNIPDQKIVAIPLFLKKLWKMVNDPDAEDIIGWNTTGDGFIIYDQVKFVTELLPQYFKHNNLSSFIRQLNFYDFHKVANIDKHEMEFAHSCFLRDLPETLTFITRKASNVKSRTNQDSKQENIGDLLSGIKELKSKHNLVNNELKMLKQENAALWNEINSLRLKYSKQTKVINKLIHFLISYMQTHQNSFAKTNITVSRKLDQQHLRNTPRLLQIDYRKIPQTVAEKNTNLKMSGSSQNITVTAPKTVKGLTYKYDNHNKYKGNLVNPVTETTEMFTRKYSQAAANSDALESIVAEFEPEVYNVTSPEQPETVLLPSKSQYPIEEIATEDDPNLEETSLYTVKFPNINLNPNQKGPCNDLPIIVANSNENPSFKDVIKKKLSPPPKVVLHHEGQTSYDKRKYNDYDLLFKTTHKPKIMKTSQKEGKAISIVNPQQKKKHLKKSKKMKKLTSADKRPVQNIKKEVTKNLEKVNPLAESSQVKSDVVLEDLFKVIENPETIQCLPEILSVLPSGPADSVLQMKSEPPEMLLDNLNEPFLLEEQPELILPTNYREFDFVDTSPTDLFSSLSANTIDTENRALFESAPEDIFLSLSNNQDSSGNGNKPLLENEVEDYPEEILSKLSTDIPGLNSPSRELQKFNIIENPKENLGLYLDNTQIQLDNIQDLLNDLNSDELLELWNCFNVDENDKLEQNHNKFLSQNVLRDDST